MNKIITQDNEHMQKVLLGSKEIRSIVQSTHGPKGKNVIINDGSIYPKFTKDGATVAKACDTNDQYKYIGMSMIKQVIDKVDSLSGDGTTTSTIYTDTLLSKAYHLASLDLNVNEIRKGMNLASEKAEEFLKSKSIFTKDIKAIANVSSNGNKEISDLLYEAFSSIGEEGIVQLSDSYKRDGTSYVELSQGIKWNQGFPSSLFITDEVDSSAKITNPYILIYSTGVEDLKPIENIINQTTRENRNLVIIAPYFDNSVFNYAASNGVLLINSPGKSLNKEKIQEEIQDLAIVVNTKIIPDVESTANLINSLNDLGTAALVVSKINSTTITQPDELSEDHIKKYETYVEGLKKRINDNDELSINEMEFLHERIARLTGGIATIHVGAPTLIEKEEKIALITDAMNSVKSSLKNGILPGGGVAMLKTSDYLLQNKDIQKDLSDEAKKGYNIVCEALRECAKNLYKSVWPNDYQYMVQEISHEKDFNIGYNLITEQKCDLVKEGIIDAAAIEYNVVKYANSVVGSFIMSKGIIVNESNNVNINYSDPKIMENR